MADAGAMVRRRGSWCHGSFVCGWRQLHGWFQTITLNICKQIKKNKPIQHKWKLLLSFLFLRVCPFTLPGVQRGGGWTWVPGSISCSHRHAQVKQMVQAHPPVWEHPDE